VGVAGSLLLTMNEFLDAEQIPKFVYAWSNTSAVSANESKLGVTMNFCPYALFICGLMSSAMKNSMFFRGGPPAAAA
jgi:hypothetical protein